MDTECVLMVARQKGLGGKEEELRGLRVQIGSYRIAMGMQSTA